MKVVVSADEVALVERRLAMAEGRVRSPARLVTEGTKRQVTAPVPWDPAWWLSCFPRLRLARGWCLVGYLVACPGKVKTVHGVCWGDPPGPGWLKRQVERLEWAPWLEARPPGWPARMNPFVEAAVRTDGTPEGWWELALFTFRLRALDCGGVEDLPQPARVVKSASDLAGRSWASAGARLPSRWLPAVEVLPGAVRVRWYERVVAGDGTEEVVRFWAKHASGRVWLSGYRTTLLVSPQPGSGG